MIVTIDGPAGAGKSSIAHQVAEALAFEFLDTGALYRAMTWGAMQNELDLADTHSLTLFANQTRLAWMDGRVLLNDQDVSDQIRTPRVTANIRCLADVPEIRDLLSQQQRRIARGRDIVTEGRDQGTEVFPDAECKIFLTASPEERALRRQQQLIRAGKEARFEDILTAQNQRDLEDRMRPVGRLRAAKDAIVISTDGMTSSEVRDEVLRVVGKCLKHVDAT